MKKYILIFSLITAFNASAETSGTCGERSGLGTEDDPYVWGDSCTWTLDGTNLTISGNGNMGQFGIVNYNAEKNTAETIAPWGLDVTTVTIDEGITGLGYRGFSGTQLSSLVLPSSITKIANGSFQFAHNLESVTIPDGVTYIGRYAFDTCANLTDVVLPSSLETIAEGAFIRSGLSSITIPDSVTTIEGWAFYDSPNLSNVIIGDGVTSIGEDAFGGTSAYVYCQNTDENPNRCNDLTNNTGLANGKLKIYTIENGKIKVGSKTYNSLNDLPGYTLKRIYTIEEANAVAGPVNRVSIKYR